MLHIAALLVGVCFLPFAIAADADAKRIVVAVSPVTTFSVTIGAVGLGGIGGAAKEADTAQKSQQLTDKARELAVPDIGARIAAGLENEPAKKGYEIVRSTSAQSAPMQPEADVVLMVILIQPGFRAQHAVSAYHPNLRALVTLRSAQSKAVLQSARI